ncbi:methylglyoxal synthase [Paracoccus sp. P2]|uniref:Methylglyoxal synthase n=1 Tax=Paracoccus pantotrophus TaxID=82367 RepID=A0A1I5GY17_PARPN|nr:methylglyoxal synthase [Paracoccus pantotrophus]MDF3854524.1 methylglyoxal synthase [Paracoccus pantotrophus]QFG38413.1 methylglyoxal synthase [Paracoccus pantotrophus]QLH15965.1 methylglyoxal synthase [Paracoccus pantotrophus]RDD98898.1 methylglyoxal synthase [Paracoccus pantotrophus]RKS51067.1 methylglyoxal synthase [Paracoccus pantotrophus]
MDNRADLALVAHDGKKDDLIAWVENRIDRLRPLSLIATGTTGARIHAATGLEVGRLLSGPLGGDAQLGAMISEGRLKNLIFFIDPLSALPHDVDVKSLLRLAILYDVRLAVNSKSADAVLAALAAE